jgi:hypothetical protein
MPNPTLLTAPSIILNQGAVGATATMPASFAAGSNRIVLIHCSMYNGAANAQVPPTFTCNGRTAVFYSGETAARNRTACVTYAFYEADIADITGQSLVSTGTGSQKSIAVSLLQDCPQSAPTNTQSGYTDVGALITLSLTRTANSLTFAYGFNSVTGQTMTFTNPSRDGTNAFTTRWASYGEQADTANTSNFTSSVGAYSSVHVFNIDALPSQEITDINSGDPVSGDTSGNTFTTTGFTEDITDVTVGGLECTAVDETAGSGTFTVPPPVHGEVYPEIGVNQDVVISGATESATLAKSFVLTGWTVTSLVDPEIVNLEYPTANFDVTPVTGDKMITEDADVISITANGGIEVAAAGYTRIIHQVEATGVMYIYGFTISAEGAVVNNKIEATRISAQAISASRIAAISLCSGASMFVGFPYNLPLTLGF